VSWAWWDWPLTCLINHHPSVLWHCWLGRVTCKIVSEITYNVSSVTLNTPIHLARVASEGTTFSACPFLFVHYRACEHDVHDILKSSEPILMVVGTMLCSPRAWNCQLFGSGGERSRSLEAVNRFVCSTVVSFSRPLCRVAFLVVCTHILDTCSLIAVMVMVCDSIERKSLLLFNSVT